MSERRDVITGTRFSWRIACPQDPGDWVPDPNGTHVAWLDGTKIVLRRVRGVRP